MFVQHETANRYATEEWPIDRIKGVHGRHTHEIDGRIKVARSCPECSHCRCPVPLDEHTE